MVNVELHESEAFAKLAEYEALSYGKPNDNLSQIANKLKISIINEIGENNYYEIVQSPEYTSLLGAIKKRMDILKRRCKDMPKGYRTAIEKTYNSEYESKYKLQRKWFGRGAWAVKWS